MSRDDRTIDEIRFVPFEAEPPGGCGIQIRASPGWSCGKNKNGFDIEVVVPQDVVKLYMKNRFAHFGGVISREEARLLRDLLNEYLGEDELTLSWFFPKPVA